jgi:hypothetical protein
MKENVRELVKRAGGSFSTHNLASNPVQYRECIELWDDKIEKFYHLIIKDCAKFLMDELDDHFAAETLIERFGSQDETKT